MKETQRERERENKEKQRDRDIENKKGERERERRERLPCFLLKPSNLYLSIRSTHFLKYMYTDTH